MQTNHQNQNQDKNQEKNQGQSQARTLEIDGMTGDACVKKVTTALKDIDGVETQSVKVGSATIKADKAGCDAACAGIKKAGYTAHEGTRTGNDRSEHNAKNSHNKDTQHNDTQHAKGQNQPPKDLHETDTDNESDTDTSKHAKSGGHDTGKVQIPGPTSKPAMK